MEGAIVNDEAVVKGRVLVVDDEPSNRRLMATLLARDGHSVRTAANGHQALEILAEEEPDLVLSDVMMPGMSGFELCTEMKSAPATRLIPVVLVTSLEGARDKVAGLDAGADDLLRKPFHAPELLARVRSLLRIRRYTSDLESAEAVMLTLALTIETRDAYTQGHCDRLASNAVALGRALGLNAEDLSVLEHGGFLHDIGKIGVPDSVLLKAGPLSRAEYEIVKQHPVVGDRLCSGMRFLRRVRAIVRHHHERLDGSGYPDGLRGDEIPLAAQIVTIVDIYDALTTARAYKPALSKEQAYEELRAEARRGWRRADLVEAFITANLG
jgi:putative two-component system response regulator